MEKKSILAKLIENKYMTETELKEWATENKLPSNVLASLDRYKRYIPCFEDFVYTRESSDDIFWEMEKALLTKAFAKGNYITQEQGILLAQEIHDIERSVAENLINATIADGLIYRFPSPGEESSIFVTDRDLALFMRRLFKVDLLAYRTACDHFHEGKSLPVKELINSAKNSIEVRKFIDACTADGILELWQDEATEEDVILFDE